MISFLQENGKKVFIHTVVGGGDPGLPAAEYYAEADRILRARMHA